MQRRADGGQDWTPAVLMTAGFALAMAAVVWIWGPSIRQGEGPGPEQPRRHAPDDVGVWVGDLPHGLVGVLTPVLRDPMPDQMHEQRLNERLGLQGDGALGLARLLVFNPGDVEGTLRLDDNLLRVSRKDGSTIASRSLAAMVERGEVQVPGDLAFTLRVLGPLQAEIAVPARGMVNLLVPLAKPGGLADTRAVEVAEVGPWRQRPMPQAALQRLIQRPDERAVEALLR